MRRLIKAAKRKVILILDNLRAHHAKLVKAWLTKHSIEIEVFYLSAYSPEINSDEYLNCDLKIGVHSKLSARNKKQLKAKVHTPYANAVKATGKGNETFSAP